MTLEIQNILRPPGEGDTMSTNRKLSKEILITIVISAVISIFLFAFLQLMATSITYNYFEQQRQTINSYLSGTLQLWINGICFLASVFFFVVIFLFLLSQKLLYLGEIISGIEALRTHHMDYIIPVVGDNEFTELAKQINYLSETERQLKQKEDALKEDREKLIRSLSHDIRTPLTSILSYSELMSSKKDRTPEEMDTYIELMHKKALQIKGLTDRLLENSIRNPEYFDHGKFLLEQILLDWEEDLSENYLCEIDWSECSDFKGHLDIQEICRIFDNLLSNIKKYADETKPVLLKLSVSENQLIIRQSNQIHLPPKPVDSHKLGIETIRSIVTRYHGTVETFSCETVFTITISIPVNL